MNVGRWTRNIDPSRTAVLLCDMLKVANTLNIPILATEQNPRALGTTIESLSEHCLNHPIYPKMRFSMIIPEIKAELDQRNITTVGLVGIESHVCILQTCLDLLNLDMNVYVMADAVSSCNLGEQKVALQSMSEAGGMVTTTESFIYRLLGDASSPHAKQVFGIVKEFSEATRDASCSLLM